MYNVISPAGEAFMVDGVWYQDYNVTDAAGVAMVKRYKHNGYNWEVVENEPKARKKIDFTKSIPETVSGINLKKSTVNLEKTFVDLTKHSGIDLNNHTARVCTALDYSASMRYMYQSGAVQRVLNRLTPLSLKFDDNGELDVWLFHSSFRHMEGLALDNYENYVEDVIMASHERYGATSYAPVLEEIKRKYVDEEPSKDPTFVIFITDGNNDDRGRTNSIVKELSRHNVFIQFVGIGYERFEYLMRLDDLKGRPVDNTGFIKVNDFDKMSDNQLYEELIVQYIDWIKTTGYGR